MRINASSCPETSPMTTAGKKPTIRDVGREAGVSYAAASYVLSRSKHAERITPATTQRILNAAAKLGYTRSSIGAALTRGYLETVVLLVVSWDIVTSFADLMILITQAAARRGLTTIVHTASNSDDANAFLLTAPSLHPYGMVLLWDSPAVSEEQLAYINSLGIPVADLMPSGPDFVSVVTPNREQAFYAIGKHLTELGHRHIGVINDFTGRSRTCHLKLAGLSRALEESGLSLEKDLLQQAQGNVFDLGYCGTVDLLSRRKDVTAIVCLTDKVACGAIAAARSLGLRVPEDISITGYGAENDSRFSTPPLTTATIPSREIASAALDMLVKARSGEAVEPRVQIVGPSDLVVGKSTGPARTWDLTICPTESC